MPDWDDGQKIHPRKLNGARVVYYLKKGNVFLSMKCVLFIMLLAHQPAIRLSEGTCSISMRC
jgi:hypothetical protein